MLKEKVYFGEKFHFFANRIKENSFNLSSAKEKKFIVEVVQIGKSFKINPVAIVGKKRNLLE